MFENLWQEWFDTKLDLMKGQRNAADGERLWRRIKKSAGGKQKELTEGKADFAIKAGITL